MPFLKSCHDLFRRMLIHIGICFNGCFNCFNCCKKDSQPNLNFNNPLKENKPQLSFVNPIYLAQHEEIQNNHSSYNFFGKIKYNELDNNGYDDFVYDITNDILTTY